jgi:hypothetical protein
MPISRSMRALVLERHSGPFILTEVELPTITASQVLVRLAENGSRSRLLCRLTSLLKWRRQWERSLWK